MRGFSKVPLLVKKQSSTQLTVKPQFVIFKLGSAGCSMTVNRYVQYKSGISEKLYIVGRKWGGKADCRGSAVRFCPRCLSRLIRPSPQQLLRGHNVIITYEKFKKISCNKLEFGVSQSMWLKCSFKGFVLLRWIPENTSQEITGNVWH